MSLTYPVATGPTMPNAHTAGRLISPRNRVRASGGAGGWEALPLRGCSDTVASSCGLRAGARRARACAISDQASRQGILSQPALGLKPPMLSPNSKLVLDSPAWHPRFDPGLQLFDEVLVRERGSRAPA